MKTLSSDLTFFYKIILPAFMVALLGAGTVLIFTSSDPGIKEFVHRDGFPLVAAVLVASVALMLWCYLPIKKVEIARDRIRVSSFAATEVIPLEAIASVSASRLMNPELIWIRLRKPSVFGNTIRFIGKYRLFGGWNRHPAAREIERRLEKIGKET